ncbi:hypothetical protein GLYMA_17G022250v4 [Glycine max]|nr:hypothetical protein GLYMA_17G022250v4 [Glycine max]KAG4929295.1 hypothetical protein JHK86_046256 [Glycine max]KAG4932032.1 hypothetical protein JHK87_046034 [Glycine soja]KAH1116356.1 hypothetical protein GYH30_045997 [Glycine max]KHN03397.1 Pentatricopeptide repeat-containing protein, mitochondrial [Glycine soja]
MHALAPVHPMFVLEQPYMLWLLFHDILEKDLVSWNSMLFAFGLHGRANEAICLYWEMVASGVKPDEVTFTGLLMTCNHLGLINEGFAFFQSMSLEFGVSHGMDHVACMVDMLGRGGYVAEATSLAEKYSKTSITRSNSCEVLLGACYAHGDLGTGLKNLEPEKEAAYVLLCKWEVEGSRDGPEGIGGSRGEEESAWLPLLYLETMQHIPTCLTYLRYYTFFNWK